MSWWPNIPKPNLSITVETENDTFELPLFKDGIVLNTLITGPVGLGKTVLLKHIAGKLAEKGLNGVGFSREFFGKNTDWVSRYPRDGDEDFIEAARKELENIIRYARNDQLADVEYLLIEDAEFLFGDDRTRPLLHEILSTEIPVPVILVMQGYTREYSYARGSGHRFYFFNSITFQKPYNDHVYVNVRTPKKNQHVVEREFDEQTYISWFKRDTFDKKRLLPGVGLIMDSKCVPSEPVITFEPRMRDEHGMLIKGEPNARIYRTYKITDEDVANVAPLSRTDLDDVWDSAIGGEQ